MAQLSALGAMDTGQIASYISPQQTRLQYNGRVPQGAVVSGVIVEAVASATNTVPNPGSSSPRIQQGDFVYGTIVEQDDALFEDDDALVSDPLSSVASSSCLLPNENQQKWHFNSSVALIVNALAHMKDSSETTLEYYLTTTFMKLTAKVVREDFQKFLNIVATQRKETAAELWKQMFKNANSPGIPNLVKFAPELTAMNDFNKHQFSVPPADMKLVFTVERVHSAAMWPWSVWRTDRKTSRRS